MKARLKILPNEPRGAAWPSSARGAISWMLSILIARLRCTNCLVKSSNERDPRVQLLISPPGEMHPVRTARVKWEEGGGDGRSVWPESPGLHVAYNGRDNGLRLRKEKLISQTRPKFGLGAETRPHEAGIPSNRLSSSSGEYVPAPCTHRPSSHPSEFLVRQRFLALSNQRFVRGAKS